jgi:hypothetical protein
MRSVVVDAVLVSGASAVTVAGWSSVTSIDRECGSQPSPCVARRAV